MKFYTPFQEDILKDIIYFTNRDGHYRYFKTRLSKLYCLDIEQIDIEIQALINIGILTRGLHKELFNGKYTTIIKLICTKNPFSEGLKNPND